MIKDFPSDGGDQAGDPSEIPLRERASSNTRRGRSVREATLAAERMEAPHQVYAEGKARPWPRMTKAQKRNEQRRRAKKRRALD